MNKEYFMGIYCPPSAPKGEYPNRITKEVYYLLHRLGIRQIYGYYDDGICTGYLQTGIYAFVKKLWRCQVSDENRFY